MFSFTFPLHYITRVCCQAPTQLKSTHLRDEWGVPKFGFHPPNPVILNSKFHPPLLLLGHWVKYGLEAASENGTLNSRRPKLTLPHRWESVSDNYLYDFNCNNVKPKDWYFVLNLVRFRTGFGSERLIMYPMSLISLSTWLGRLRPWGTCYSRF